VDARYARERQQRTGSADVHFPVSYDVRLDADEGASSGFAAPLVCATDGSKGARGESGYGWVTAEGAFGYGTIAGPIVVAEIAAVLALLKGTPRDRPLHVLVDSRCALTVLDNIRRGAAVTAQHVPGRYAHWDLLRRTRRALQGRDVRLTWVPAHSGVELNEIADRIAVQARRHHDAGTEPAVLERLLASIASEAVAGHAVDRAV
jgi:ribonuclease HI